MIEEMIHIKIDIMKSLLSGSVEKSIIEEAQKSAPMYEILEVLSCTQNPLSSTQMDVYIKVKRLISHNQYLLF